MSDENQFCTFYVDGFFFGIEVSKVQEVIRYQKMTRVPLAPQEIHGLINLRGKIVTAIDLRQRMDLRPRSAEKLPMNVVVRSEDGVVSLLVDEIGDVLEVENKIFERAPETLTGVSKQLIRGAYKLKGRLLLVLDTRKATEIRTVEQNTATTPGN